VNRMLLLWLALIPLCCGYNILVSIPNVEKSESTLAFYVTNGLLDAGHNVTLITSFKFTREHKNLKVIWIPEILTASEKIMDDAGLDWEKDFYNLLASYEDIKIKTFLKDKRILEIFKNRNTFDLLLSLSHFCESSFIFLMNNDIPFVQIVTPGMEIFPLANDGHLVSPAVMPNLRSAYSEYMTFWERTKNLLSILDYYYGTRKAARVYMESVTKKFPDLEEYDRFYDRVSLTLINSHFTLDGPFPLLPNHVEIGSIHCRKALPLREVDKELADFVEGSGDAGHPKTKVFISHCGNLGTQETKYHGVPVLGLPIGFDQPRSCAKMVKKGQALTLQWDTLTVEKIVESLNTLVNNPSYRENMKTLSKIVQDQKDTPMDRAIWWIEYVIRHKGAPHLTYAGKHLSLFQYVMLDVILVWLCVFLFLIFSVFYVIKIICCKERGRKDGKAIGSPRKNVKKYQ
ncbi:UDP-glucuronosyltransferase, partial [Armadillidium nasatum]